MIPANIPVKFFSIRALFLFILYFSASHATAQVGIGANPPDSSAMLHVQDTARGMLIPRMTAAQKNAIQHPAEGLMIYQTNDSKGFYYYNGNSWVNIAQNSMGAHVLILTDDITNQQAQAKIAAEAGPFTREIKIINCPNLTTVDLSKITELTNLVIINNPLLESVYLPNLVYVIGGETGISIKQNPNLGTLNLSSLKSVITYNTSGPTGIAINNTKIVNFNLPSLIKASQVNISANNFIETLSMPMLQSCAGYSSISANPLLGSISLPALTAVSQFIITTNDTLASVSLPALTTTNGVASLSNYGSFWIQNNRNLASITLAPFTFSKCQEYLFSGNKLSSQAVNDILHVLAASPAITSKSIDLSLQRPSGAPPTGQGIIDRATLSSRSNTVTTD